MEANRRSLSEQLAYVNAVSAALENDNGRKLNQLLDSGPRRLKLSSEAQECKLNELFPINDQSEEACRNEQTRWTELRQRLPAEPFLFKLHHLKRWATKNPSSYGGASGWTGALFKQLGMIDHVLLTRLSDLLARPPLTWNCVETAESAYRNVDGWWVPKPDFPAAPVRDSCV